MMQLVGIVLAGGRGTRLKEVCNDCPKPFIPCGGRPFIDWVIDWFAREGVNDFVVSLGYLAEVGERHFATWGRSDSNVKTVVETDPLGTGGAIRLAWSERPDLSALVLNGDSLLLADFAPAWNLWQTTSAEVIVIGVPQEDASRYGTLTFTSDGRLLSFEEKRFGSGVINAGVYLIRPTLFAEFPMTSPLSIERDVFPVWLRQGRDIRVVVLEAPFIDIGLPESLSSAEGFLQTNWPKGSNSP